MRAVLSAEWKGDGKNKDKVSVVSLFWHKHNSILYKTLRGGVRQYWHWQDPSFNNINWCSDFVKLVADSPSIYQSVEISQVNKSKNLQNFNYNGTLLPIGRHLCMQYFYRSLNIVFLSFLAVTRLPLLLDWQTCAHVYYTWACPRLEDAVPGSWVGNVRSMLQAHGRRPY